MAGRVQPLAPSSRAAEPRPPAERERAPVGLYVHFPACLSVCPYCDFVVAGGSAARGPRNMVQAFVHALAREIELRGRTGSATRAPLRSVYLGGGTPSLMAPAQVEQLLTAADRAFGIAGGVEVTLEANPGPAERGDLAGVRAAGVNRLSIGAQSLDADELRRIGRRHSPADVRETVVVARQAGLDNISLDLLYDIPGQTLDSWRRTLGQVLALEPDHVSAYALTLDDPDAEGLSGPVGDHLPLRAGARRWRERARHGQDGDRAADMYLLADEVLSAAGLAWYEISNWARPGRQSRHNLAYWHGDAWEAVGPGAHAFDGARTRRWNAAHLARYLAALAQERLPPGEQEAVGPATAAAESTILRLRTATGVAPADLPVGTAGALAWGRAAGLLEAAAGERVRLTAAGRLAANELMLRLLPAADPGP